MRWNDDRGIILPSVLIILALASTVVMMMISIQEVAIQRSRRFNEAAQASAYASGGVLSVLTAVRRDAVTAPETDNLTEPWAALADDAVAIEGGTFSLQVYDAQARFNVNNLAAGDLSATKSFISILSAARLPASTAARVAAYLKATGPVSDLDELARAGLTRAELDTLAPLVTALPVKTTVNANTASEELLAALLDNRAAARALVARRNRSGLLRPEDVNAARVVLPPGIAFTSNFFEVGTSVTIGDTTQAANVLIQRETETESVRVAVLRRTKARTAPSEAPPAH